MIAGVVIDDWKLPIFKRHLDAAGFTYTQHPGVTKDTITLKVLTEWVHSDRQLVSGEPVPEDGSHRELKENGQQRDYVILSPAERAKGFVQPVRRSYIHTPCNGLTTMSQSIAETYARDPWFYSGTFCCNCGVHKPLEEFVWAGGGSMSPLKWTDEEFKRVAERKAELRGA
jgi:hypothetical protein